MLTFIQFVGFYIHPLLAIYLQLAPYIQGSTEQVRNLLA